jgi:EAL domain-containing protein (putative c-di-GMP-specific phosphodiesterase class I)
MKEKKSFSYFRPLPGINQRTGLDYESVRHANPDTPGFSAGELPALFQEKKLIPYFQPIIGVASGKIIGYEALARQIDAEGRVSSAGELFSSPEIADELLIQWDRMIRRQALNQFSQANCSGYLAINISAKWIDCISDCNNLPTLRMLDEFHIDRSRIVVEITESKGDLNKLVEIVKIYRSHGLSVAIDDFGAGFSQLERVRAIKPDIIKLDMRLFKEAIHGGIAGEIVNLLIRLAERTGCRIVCEGVETEDEFFFGLSCGAQYMQGYLFSPATPEFKNSTEYQEQIGDLRKKFLDRTLSKERRKIQYSADIKKLCEYLKNTIKASLRLGELPASPFQESGVIRFYICNNGGEQISSNFNFTDGKWWEDAAPIGFNWAWRPYFYQLLALESAKKNYRLITSERYRDFNTDVLCKTLSLRLDDERILLIDIASKE